MSDKAWKSYVAVCRKKNIKPIARKDMERNTEVREDKSISSYAQPIRLRSA